MEIWFAEIQGVAPALRQQLPYVRDVIDSDGFFAALGRSLGGVEGVVPLAGLLAWYRFVALRLRPEHEEDPVVGVHFQRLHWAAFAGSGRAPALRGYDPADAADPDPVAEPRRLLVVQLGGALTLMPMEAMQIVPPGSLLAVIHAVHPKIKIEPLFDSALSDRKRFGKPASRPPGAEDWGWDDCGAWVTFSVEAKDRKWVTQRSAGSSWMAHPTTSNRLAVSVVERPRYAPGRPKRNAVRTRIAIEYGLAAEILVDEVAIERRRKMAGCFVLPTNVEGEGTDGYSAEQISGTYKEQYAIERNFSFLKDDQIVNALFLEARSGLRRSA